ncbi:MAG TPA: crossover junction endodeoxyribonuclease RuvC [Candidatus Acidoferrales bacterium]|nr:crossover junction endodeoxyribonuclease RuvC [Candidatus Acidoferrales bacterium]
MRILGLDPSLRCTGYGVVEFANGSTRLVEGGIISPARSGTLEERLAELQRSLAEILGSLRPDVMVVEEVFSRTAYPKTAIVMAHARGALISAAALAHTPIFHYSATAVKRALVGNGAASKQQVAAMVVQTLHLRRRPSPADVTDALALAIAHGRRHNGRTR